MIFAVGDRVRYNLLRPESNLPQWRGTTWRIAALTGDLFARLENDNGDIQDRISTAMLVPVTADYVSEPGRPVSQNVVSSGRSLGNGPRAVIMNGRTRDLLPAHRSAPARP